MARFDAFRTITCVGCLETVTRRLRSNAKYCSRRCYLDHKPNPVGWNGSDAERFWAKVDKSGECWLWTGHIQHGYGNGYFFGKSMKAHRVSWIIDHGRPIPRRMNVLHHCDNPPCVRPSHLFLGTQKDNWRDMVDKGRAAPQFIPKPVTWNQIEHGFGAHA